MSMHNKAILHQIDRKTRTVDKICNCRNPSTCPVEECFKKWPIVYKATLTSQNKSMVYYMSYETEFKSRHNNNKQSFKVKKKIPHRTLESSLECQRCKRNPTDRVVHYKKGTTINVVLKHVSSAWQKK